MAMNLMYVVILVLSMRLPLLMRMTDDLDVDDLDADC